jgi:hypothetical protein
MTGQDDIRAILAQLSALEAIAHAHGWKLLAYLLSLARAEARIVETDLDALSS